MDSKKQTILSVLSIVLASCSFFSVFLGFNVGVLGPIIGIIICLIAIVLGVNASHIDKSKALPKVGIWLSVSFAILNLVFCITCVTLCGGETGEKSIETTFNGCTEASCKSDKAKYGGYGFYYMNGFSSTDFSDYMVTKKRSKLVTLDHEPSLVIENEEDMPVMDGAEACYPLYAAVAKAVYKDIDKIESGKLSIEEENSNGKIVTFTNTIHAFRRLIKNDGYFDKVDLFFGAHPSTDQIRGAEAMDIELLITKIGSEAFVFFVEDDNPVDNLTSDQIRAIYHGDITNWKEVGGPDQEIVAFQRPENSGSQVVMHDFMGEVGLKDPKTYEIKDAMGQVTKEVAQYYGEEGAMGYSFRYFLEELNQEEGVKILSVDGVYPSLENIENGSYGIVTDLCLVTRKNDPNPFVQKMIDFMLSEDGQYIVRQTGYAGNTEKIETNDSKKYVSDMTEDELVDFLSKYTEYDTLSDYLRNRMLGYLKSQMFQLDHPGDADIPRSSTEYIDFTKQIKDGLKEYYGGEIPVHEVINGFVTVFDEPEINISKCNSFYNISLTKDEVSTIRNAIDEVEWREDGLAEHPEFYYDGYIIFLSYGKCDQYYFSVQQGIVYYDHYYGALKDTDVAYIKDILEISENGK